MIAAWMLYAIVVGVLLGASGLALEALLRMHSLPSRWIWMTSILLSVVWPLGHRSWDSRPPPVTPPPVAEAPTSAPPGRPADVLPLESVTVEVAPESVLRLLDRPILIGWALATAAFSLFFLGLFYRTHRLRNGWRKGRLEDQAVLFSDEWGPAVVGFFRPRVVLPRWCEDLDGGTLRLIVDHELEHVRAGDLQLLILVGTIPVLFPWHLPVWWQLARLRTAVEGDCDLRVLHRNPGQTRPYIDLLLAMGRRPGAPPSLAAMLSEPYETLKRRIRIMTMPMPKRPWITGGLLAGIAAVLGILACAAPGPTDAKGGGGEPVAGSESPPDGGMVGKEPPLPTFTPFSVRPEVRNREEVVAALERAFAELGGDPGIGGTADVWLFVDEESRVQDIRLNRSTGHRDLDGVAIGLSDVIELTSALNRDQERAVWVSLPIAFTAGDAREPRGYAVPEAGNRRSPVITESTHFAAPADTETGAVTGMIRHAATDRPVADAQVFVRGTGRGTLSNGEGRFRIDHIPVGQHEVVAHLIGHGNVSTAVSIAPGEASEADFRLRETVIALDPLVVRSYGAPRRP